MKIHLQSRSGLTLIEMAVTAGLVGVLGLIIYSLLNIGTILGAKNTATNTAHQQARVAMLEMIQHLHSAVSLPAMTNATGTPYPSPAPASSEGIAFQQWSMGPFKIIADTAALPSTSPTPGVSQNFVMIRLPSSTSTWPGVNQRLIIPTYQIEGDITAVDGPWDNMKITLANIPAPSPAPSPTVPPGTLPVRIQGTTAGATPSAAGDIVCYVTDLCSYTVVQASAGPPIVYKLVWTKKGVPDFVRDIVTDVTNPKPFSIPVTPAGAPYNRFVAAIDLSTSDPNYSNRGYKSANILLNGQVPFKARLTTYQ
jgi:hypothetical protein